ncbi:MAG: hypothetical protein A2147_08840 [Chloroflexi bacterium RBG_16_57_8]|nr:MAG: hypothetical protein A2147_08840 [Chloroflexi bacterium RBG_16_57_8]
MTDTVYINGKLVLLEQARASVMDYGFLFGYGLFETMRAYGGKVYRLDDHINRLTESAPKLGIEVERTALRKAVYDTLQANRLTDARIRLIVTIGEGSLTPDIATCTSPTVIVIAAPYHPHAPEVYNKGWRVIISAIRRNSQSPLPGLKSSNFLESMLVKQEVRNAGVDDALMLNDKGLVAEASSSNVFVVSGGGLTTPRVGGGLLPGVTRRLVLELAKHLPGVKSAEADIAVDGLSDADEVFLTNSMVEIMPVVEIGGRMIGDGKPGPITRRLMQAYKQRVLTETQ